MTRSTLRPSEARPRKPGGFSATYLLLTLVSTLAASFIWGINNLFLLDAGLNNAEAFAADAFFTAGMVIFEVPTGCSPIPGAVLVERGRY